MTATERESSDRAHAVRAMFDRFVAEHDVIVADARPGSDHATASFAAVTGREGDLVAQIARLADLTVVPHPEVGEDVSSSDALHAVLFNSGRPVLIAPHNAPRTIGRRFCVAWNGTAKSAAAVLAAVPWMQEAEAVPHPVGGRVPAAGTGRQGPRGLSRPSRCAGRDRDFSSGEWPRRRRLARFRRGVWRRLPRNGGVFSLAAAPAHPGRRDPARARERDHSGYDKSVGAHDRHYAKARRRLLPR